MTVLFMFLFSALGAAQAAGQVLTPGKWAPTTKNALQKMINENGSASKNYKKDNPPYAVFDWDNTCIMNDTEEALYMYQIDNLAFKLTPEEFGKLLVKNVPAGPFSKDYTNADGKIVTLEDITTDLNSDYKYIYENFSGMKGSKTLEEIQKTDQFLDFRAKMWFIYDAIGGTHGTKVSYTWVLFFFQNMTTAEVQALAEKSNDYALGQALKSETWTSPASLPGKAGVVGISHKTGLRITEEVCDLMATLRSNGIEVYVCSASLEDVVAVFATNPKYGYNLPRANVIGMRLEQKDGVYQDAYKAGWVQTAEHGKTIAIQQTLADKKGFGPILVCGDSSGDYEMMTEFKDTKNVLIVNRAKTGNIGKVSKTAVETIGKADAKYLLQGRNENTGLWRPSEKLIKLGKTAEVLVP